MSSQYLRLSRLSFTYEGQIALFKQLNITVSSGFTALIGANGRGKSTLLKLIAGLLHPDSGRIERPGICLYVDQNSDELPSFSEDQWFDLDDSQRRIASMLHLSFDDLDRWPVLSFGERRRWYLALALWQDPAVLCLDEPTNHLDLEAKELLLQVLRRYEGIALIASHDRMVLEQLASQSICFEANGPVLRALSPLEALKQQELEQQSARRLYEENRREVKRLKETAVQLRQKSDQSSSRLSKRHIDPKDHDAKGRRDAARLTGKDRVAGDQSAHMNYRLEQAGIAASESFVAGTTKNGFSFDEGQSKVNRLVALEAGSLKMGEKELIFPAIEIRQGERIALEGSNGAGKSSFLHYLAGYIKLPQEQVIFIKQEYSLPERRQLLAQLEALPDKIKGEALSVISRLGSSPTVLLQSQLPSPGESRKLALALKLFQNPLLIIMDEPTNHLDLPAIKALEESLMQSKAALLMVSHDQFFIKKITERHWHIKKISNWLNQLFLLD